MTENIKKLLEAVSKDEALREEFRNVKSKEAVTEFAAKQGIVLTDADFKRAEDEISLDEANAVAGGGSCFSTHGIADPDWCDLYAYELYGDYN